MSIGTELEKLTSLRDRGDLSQAEFDKAKERLLFGEATGASQATETSAPPLPEEGGGGKPKQHLLIAILSTIAAAFSAVSAVIDPDTLSLLAFSLFAFVSALNWIEISRARGWKR